MKFLDLFKMSVRMFKARTSRTFLTVLGMSVGIGAILFLVSFGYGLQKTLLEKITTAESLLTLDVTENRETESILDQTALDKLSAIGEVAEVSPSFQLSAQGIVDNITVDMSAVIIKPSYLRLGGVEAAHGSLLNDNNKQSVVISSTVAQIYGNEDPSQMIGKTIAFNFYVPVDQNSKDPNSQNNTKKVSSDKRFEIAGIIESEDNLVYIHTDTLTDLSISRYSQVKVKSKSQNILENVRGQVVEMGYLVSALSDTVDQANKVFRIVQLVLMLFGVIALIVSAIGMFNTMTIALLERTEEIGIMKSIGASDTSVSLMFIMESTIMGFLGGVGGILIGMIGGEIVNMIINFVATHFGGEAVRLFYSPIWFIAAILVFAGVVGMLTGFMPARRASRIDPLDALRYK